MATNATDYEMSMHFYPIVDCIECPAFLQIIYIRLLYMPS